MNRRLKYIVLALSVILITIYLILPVWFKEGTPVSFSSWYPNSGHAVYIGIHYLFPLLILMLLLFLLFLIGKEILVEKKFKRNVYGLILIVLIGQFYICYEYEEFYPAVIMPRFTNGKNFKHQIKNIRGEVHIEYDKNKVAKFDVVELLSSFHGNNASKNFIAKRMLKNIKHIQNVDWILTEAKKITHSIDIRELRFYKVEHIYQYEGMEGLIKKKEERDNIYTIKTE